jgi:hypothetical protein
MADYLTPGLPAGYPETPELDKQQWLAEQHHTQDIGAFLEWLQSQGYGLYQGFDEFDRPLVASMDINKLLAAWLDIDLQKVEEERRAILKFLSEQNARATAEYQRPREEKG